MGCPKSTKDMLHLIDTKDSSQKKDYFILEFERRYNGAKQKEMELFQAVLAFRLLDASQVEQKDEQLVLTGVDYSKKTDLFDQMKSSLRKIFNKEGCTSGDGFRAVRIKEESVNMAGQHPQRWRGNFGFRNGQNRFSYKSGSNNTYGQKEGRINGSNTVTDTVSRERTTCNPCDVNGNVVSVTLLEHFRRDCPRAEENSKNVLEVENERKPTRQKGEDINKVTEYIPEGQDLLMCEAANSTVLESACSKTVTGHIWKEMYLDSL